MCVGVSTCECVFTKKSSNAAVDTSVAVSVAVAVCASVSASACVFARVSASLSMCLSVFCTKHTHTIQYCLRYKNFFDTILYRDAKYCL